MGAAVDFTSSHYLGWHHPSSQLPGWSALTTGRPAALEDRGEAIGARLARLVGAERGLVSRSTLHAGWDLGHVLGGPATVVLVDAGAYPSSAIVSMTAASRGSIVACFAHHDATALERAAARSPHRRPVILVDGWCPSCGDAPPVVEYHRIARVRDGVLVVDDTQGVGVLGSGGTVSSAGAPRGPVVVVASLAKAFAAPVALTAGPRAVVDRLRDDGPSRSASSPATAADLAATAASLRRDAAEGDHRRERLACLVHRFRRQARAAALPVIGAPFPVQSIGPLPFATTARAHAALAARGVAVVPQRLRCRSGTALTFLLTAGHRNGDIDRAVTELSRVLGGHREPTP